MDLIDLIESHRFMGNEFMMWLWYKSDIFEGRFMIGERPCEVWFDDRITLEAVVIETEQSVLKGASPTFTPEAREALRQGKLPTQARLRIIYDGQEFQFVLKGAELAMSGIKLPALMTRADDEKFYERMYLIEMLEELLEDLYGEFLSMRLSEKVWGEVVAAIRAWIFDAEALMATDAWGVLKAKAVPLKRHRTSTRVERRERAASAAAEEIADDVVEAAASASAVPVPPPSPDGAEITAPA